MNDVKLFGNIAQAPEHGQTNNGTPFCNFSVGSERLIVRKPTTTNQRLLTVLYMDNLLSL